MTCQANRFYKSMNNSGNNFHLIYIQIFLLSLTSIWYTYCLYITLQTTRYKISELKSLSIAIFSPDEHNKFTDVHNYGKNQKKIIMQSCPIVSSYDNLTWIQQVDTHTLLNRNTQFRRNMPNHYLMRICTGINLFPSTDGIENRRLW